MATFTNQATLSYNGYTTNSNVVTGEILEVLSAVKTAVVDSYRAGDAITYVISLVNSGPSAFTGLTLSDDLGSYLFGTESLVPLDYVDGSVQYYVNGALQPAPAVTAGPPMTVTGISVPAGGNAMLIYNAMPNGYAPLRADDVINNEVTVTGAGLSAPVTAQETVEAAADARLTITKALSPAAVAENGQLTYTFTIQNTGNTAVVSTDNAAVTDLFSPALDPITVSYNGVVWTEGTQYTYDAAAGRFATVPGQITVDAAVYTQDADSGLWIMEPGVSTLTVTGTV